MFSSHPKYNQAQLEMQQNASIYWSSQESLMFTTANTRIPKALKSQSRLTRRVINFQDSKNFPCKMNFGSQLSSVVTLWISKLSNPKTSISAISIESEIEVIKKWLMMLESRYYQGSNRQTVTIQELQTSITFLDDSHK